MNCDAPRDDGRRGAPAVEDPLYYGNLLVREGRADGSVAGATNTTAHTVRAALHCIGVRAGLQARLQFFRDGARATQTSAMKAR